MKLTLLILLFTSFELLSQDLPGISESLKKRLEQIVYSDTAYNDSTSIRTIRYYDNTDKIVKQETRNIHSSLAFWGPSTKVYNENDSVILEQIQDYKGIIWHRYVYTYDKENKLVSKEGFSSGELGHRIEFIYDKNGVLTEQVEKRNGEIVNRKKIK